MPTKSCFLDPAPSKVVKECLDRTHALAYCYYQSVITVWCLSRCVERGSCNSHAKEVWFWPGFQKLSPYLSNLQFVSKLVERAAAGQLQSHLVKNNLFPTLQSAYRPNDSTETALLKIKNDILINMDKQHATLLILLDLSAAFDAVDHQILLNHLCTEFGVSGKVLD